MPEDKWVFRSREVPDYKRCCHEVQGNGKESRSRRVEIFEQRQAEIKEMKIQKGGLTAGTWYLRNSTYKVISCQATPGGVLAKKIKAALNPTGTKEGIQVTEDWGQPAVAFRRRSDPFKSEGCRFEDAKCLVESNQDCAAMGAIYEITCKACRSVVDPPVTKEPRSPGGQKLDNYVGITATSVHWRMASHLKGQRAKSNSNPLYRHDRDHHHGEPQEYLTRILGRERFLLPPPVTGFTG